LVDFIRPKKADKNIPTTTGVNYEKSNETPIDNGSYYIDHGPVFVEGVSLKKEIGTIINHFGYKLLWLILFFSLLVYVSIKKMSFK
jgi:hypothetical protein